MTAVNSHKLPENVRNVCRRCSIVAAPPVAAVAARAADAAAADDTLSRAAAARDAAGICVCVYVCLREYAR